MHRLVGLNRASFKYKKISRYDQQSDESMSKNGKHVYSPPNKRSPYDLFKMNNLVAVIVYCVVFLFEYKLLYFLLHNKMSSLCEFCIKYPCLAWKSMKCIVHHVCHVMIDQAAWFLFIEEREKRNIQNSFFFYFCNWFGSFSCNAELWTEGGAGTPSWTSHVIEKENNSLTEFIAYVQRSLLIFLPSCSIRSICRGGGK